MSFNFKVCFSALSTTPVTAFPPSPLALPETTTFKPSSFLKASAFFCRIFTLRGDVAGVVPSAEALISPEIYTSSSSLLISLPYTSTGVAFTLR